MTPFQQQKALIEMASQGNIDAIGLMDLTLASPVIALPPAPQPVVDPAVLRAIPQQPQVQDALNDQLAALVGVANKLGLYDAADYLRRVAR